MTPSIGRIVHYALSERDAELINQLRDHGHPGILPAYVGHRVEAGDVFPMVIVRVQQGSAISEVNGQVFLDGPDTLWVIARGQVETESTDQRGCWFAPPRVG